MANLVNPLQSMSFWLARYKVNRAVYLSYKRNCKGKREARWHMRWCAEEYGRLRGLIGSDCRYTLMLSKYGGNHG